MLDMIKIEKPNLGDVAKIKGLIDVFVKDKDILPRSSEDIAERIREFVVAKEKDNVVATSSLRLYYPYLAEIRTITVDKNYQGRNLGKRLVEFELSEAKALGVKQVFALTFKIDFFYKLGFSKIDKKELPLKKIWEDCINCPFFPDCKEESVLINV